MAFQKQLIFFDGAILYSDTSQNADVMIAQVPGGASGLSIGLARPVRIYGQVKTAGFNNFSNLQVQAHLRNATGTVNEEIYDETTARSGNLDTVRNEPFVNLVIPVVPELATADRIRVTVSRSGGSAPTTGEVFIGLIIGGAGIYPNRRPGVNSWDTTGLRIDRTTVP